MFFSFPSDKLKIYVVWVLIKRYTHTKSVSSLSWTTGWKTRALRRIPSRQQESSLFAKTRPTWKHHRIRGGSRNVPFFWLQTYSSVEQIFSTWHWKRLLMMTLKANYLVSIYRRTANCWCRVYKNKTRREDDTKMIRAKKQHWMLQTHKRNVGQSRRNKCVGYSFCPCSYISTPTLSDDTWMMSHGGGVKM